MASFTCSYCDIEKPEEDFDRTQCQRARRRNKAMCRRCLKHRALVGLYGLTIKQYDAMLEAQDHCCACCHDAFDENTETPHVDHNHDTGVVRALLCARCNLAIGHLKEQPVRALQAAHYLLDHEEAPRSRKSLRKLCRQLLGRTEKKTSHPKVAVASDHAGAAVRV